MQFPFKTTQYLSESSSVAVLDGYSLAKTIKQIKPEQYKQISDIVNRMGSASAAAQNLKQIITTFQKFVGSDNRIYFKVEDNKILGMLKVGERNLFYRDYIGNIKQIRPTCVLDFYVHQSCQRAGIGKEIFQYFLRKENKRPEKLAYDRPSEKLMGFLRKHYGLIKHIAQNNNYVIFNSYFEEAKDDPKVQNQRQLMNKSLRSNEFIRQKLSFLSNDLKNLSSKVSENGHSRNSAWKKNESKEEYKVSSPWASTNPDSSLIFRTTSNQYGEHYLHK